jgi:hypothetical protein
MAARESRWAGEKSAAQNRIQQLGRELHESQQAQSGHTHPDSPGSLQARLALPPTDTQPAGSQQVATGRDGAAPTELAFAIPPGIFRDGNERVLRVPQATKTLRLTLEADTILRRSVYGTAIRTEEGNEVWRGSGRIVATPAARPAVTITVPAEIFRPGRYLIAVSEDQSKDVINDYAFRISR